MGLRFYVSDQFPGKANTAGPRSTVLEPSLLAVGEDALEGEEEGDRDSSWKAIGVAQRPRDKGQTEPGSRDVGGA